MESYKNIDVTSIFCNYDNMLKYFRNFHYLLQDSKCKVELQDLCKFLECLEYAERTVFSQTNNESEKMNEFKGTFFEIFDILSGKYLSEIESSDKVSRNNDSVSVIFEAIALLIKIIVNKFNGIVCLDHVFSYIKGTLSNCTHFINNSESEQCETELLQCIFKFLQSISQTDISKCLSSDALIEILKVIPLSDKNAVNIFINHLIPNLYSTCDDTVKKCILELLWERIVVSFEKKSTSENPYFYSLLCCFSDFISKEHFELTDFNIMDDILWKIIQTGLRSNNSFNRKQAIYIFKIYLFLFKTRNAEYYPISKDALFSFQSSNDVLIWNELVVLFEILEEKQAHVIKPVLPKFSRILQYLSKSAKEESHFLHPTWITCFIHRMISHESKFVAKQGLSIAMNINYTDCRIHHLDSEEFIQVLMKGFNDQNMYCRMLENDNLSLFLTSKKILVFLTKYIEAFETEQQKVNFLRFLLKLIASESWNGVAILHFIFALSNLKSLPSWKSEDIFYLRSIQSCLKSHELILRSTVEYWLLKCCILFMDWNSLSLEDMSELLFIFKNLERKTVVWNMVVSKLKEIFFNEFCDNLFVNEVERYCLMHIRKIQSGDQNIKKSDLQKIARMLMLLADSSMISHNSREEMLNWSYLLQPLTSILLDAPKRPYMAQEVFFKVLQFYTLLIETCKVNSKNANDDQSCAIIKCLNCSTEFIEFLYQKSFLNIHESDDIINFEILYNTLYVFSSLDSIKELFIKLLPSFTMKYNNMPENLLSKKILIVLFYSISVYQLNEIKSKNLVSNLFNVLSINILSKIIDEQVINCLSKSVFVKNSEKETWLDIATNSISNFWNVTRDFINHLSDPDSQVFVPAIIQLVQNSFYGSSKVTYASTISCVQTLVPKLGLESISVIQGLLDSSWKACSELQGCDAYRLAVNAFIKTIFQSYMLEEEYFEVLYRYMNNFQNISENSLGIFYFAMKQFCKEFELKCLYRKKFNCIPILIHALTYGPIHHKSQKILEDTVTYISEQDEYFAEEFKNYDKPSIFVRVVVTIYLMKHLYKGDSENEKIFLELLNNLLVLDDSTKSSKSSKFSNSYNHRIRNRIWQIILLLQPNLKSKGENEIILKKILELLEFENQQPSVRYFQEWFVLKILNDHACFIEVFIANLEISTEKRPGFLVSLLSILSHLIMHNNSLSKNHACLCFPFLINCCMAQNFAVRLYGRLTLLKLMSFCEQKKLTDLMEKYDFLQNMLLSSQPEYLLEKGNVYKNLLKLQEDFYFAQFHPIRHFTIETIFYELPRLSNVASDEWIKPVYFQDHLDVEFEDFVIPCFNADNCLRNSVPCSVSDKSREEFEVVENDTFDYNFQKKICPVRIESGDCDVDLFIEKKQKKGGLIVIASLIDRIPNLGGLCRTCEVFSVDEFVIGSLKYIEDKQFQNLAVSSHKWVSIKEVKPYDLKEYLLSLKEEGYCLVGAEQTGDSMKLIDYNFKKKSALLLGHEKEGIPVNLIQLLDACVEIPQQGIIRSLNVHVSGAIFIWEYARQQMK